MLLDDERPREERLRLERLPVPPRFERELERDELEREDLLLFDDFELLIVSSKYVYDSYCLSWRLRQAYRG